MVILQKLCGANSKRCMEAWATIGRELIHDLIEQSHCLGEFCISGSGACQITLVSPVHIVSDIGMANNVAGKVRDKARSVRHCFLKRRTCFICCHHLPLSCKNRCLASSAISSRSLLSFSRRDHLNRADSTTPKKHTVATTAKTTEQNFPVASISSSQKVPSAGLSGLPQHWGSGPFAQGNSFLTRVVIP